MGIKRQKTPAPALLPFQAARLEAEPTENFWKREKGIKIGWFVVLCEFPIKEDTQLLDHCQAQHSTVTAWVAFNLKDAHHFVMLVKPAQEYP